MGSGKDGKGKKEVLDLDDPLAGAEDSIKESGVIPMPTVKPPPGSEPMRERQMTLIDDEITEQARIASVLIDSVPPAARGNAAPNSPQAIRARLAPLDRIPALSKSIAELGEVLKDPKTAFVAGFVDGLLPLETIIEVTGLPEPETLQILDRLIAQGAIVFPPRR